MPYWEKEYENEELARILQSGVKSDTYSRNKAIGDLVQGMIEESYRRQNRTGPDYNSMIDTINRYPEMESMLNSLFDESWKQRRFDNRMKQRGTGRWDTLPGLNFDDKKWIY